MTYYLDTSTIRSSGNKLALIPCNINVQTSYLAVMEIITGIPSDSNDIDIPKCEKEFKSRRNSLKYLLDSNILIDEIWVDEVIDRAFNFPHKRLDSLYFTDSIKILSTLVSQSSDYKTFISSLDSLRLRDELKNLQVFDEHTSKSFTTSSYQQIKDALNCPNASFPSEQPPKKLSDIRDYLNSNRGLGLNYSMALYSLCSRVAVEPTEAVYNSYNNELDIFLYVWAISGTDAIAKQDAYGRNDGIDLLHLVYVKDGDTFVTGDNKIRELAKLANRVQGISIRSISSEEFFSEAV